jgi:hypothetical protein
MTTNKPTDHAPTAQPCLQLFLKRLESSLSFISLTAGRIEGKHEEDWLATDAIQAEVDRIRELRLELLPACEGEIVMSAEAADRRLVA